MSPRRDEPGPVSRIEPSRFTLSSWLGPALALAVVLSRWLMLPDGPWEQDEAIFASAIVDFDLAAHRPHPPGFPGYIAGGRLVTLLTGDPLLALRIIGSLSSGALAWGLARLLSRRLPLSLAWGVAVLHALLPVVWFHGGRAFSTTPACALAVWSLELWLEHPHPEASAESSRWSARLGASFGPPAGWILAAAALTVRPHLAPLVAWLALVRLVPRDGQTLGGCLKREALGIAMALAIGLVAYGWVVVDSGGWASFVRICEAHFRQHAKVLGNGAPLAELGVVRGVGGVGWASLFTALGVAGLVALWRGEGAGGAAADREGAAAGDGWMVATWVGGACVIAAVLVLRFHAPTFPRYSVLLVSAAIVPVGLSALWLDRIRQRRPWVDHAALGLTAAMAAAKGEAAWPAVSAAHGQAIPPVAALRAVPEHGDGVLLYSHGHSAFVGYFLLTRKLFRKTANTDRAGQRLGEGDVDYVGRAQGGRVLPGATVAIHDFDDFPEAAWEISQRRYGWTQWAHNPVWLGEGVHGIEHGERDEPFAWLSETATLRPPNGAASLELVVRIDEGFAPQPIAVEVQGTPGPTWRELGAGLHRLSIPLEDCALERSGCEVDLGMANAKRIDGDGRVLSVRLLGAWVDGPGVTAAPQLVTPGQPGRVAAADMKLEGFYPPDRFVDDTRYGAWSGSFAVVQARAEPGTMRFELARPKDVSGPVEIVSGEGRWSFDVVSEPTWYEIEIGASDGYAFVTLNAPTFSPGNGDERSLGLIVLGIETRPAESP